LKYVYWAFTVPHQLNLTDVGVKNSKEVGGFVAKIVKLLVTFLPYIILIISNGGEYC
jgi:hypothetical protein